MHSIPSPPLACPSKLHVSASPPLRGWLLALLLSSFIIPHSSFGAESPTLIPFQARLTDQDGNPYTNGTYTITFNIYSDAVGGSTAWAERHEKVGLVNGMVNVFLGSIQPFTNVQANPNDDVDFSTTRYLGITVDADDNPATADPEMVPRQMIIPAFYAKNSQKLAGHDWSTILVTGNNPQTGFLNGAKLGSGTVTNVQIQDGGITTADIGNGQVTGAKLAPGAADGAISDESITSVKIKDGEVKTADIQAASVTSAKIAEGSVNLMQQQVRQVVTGSAAVGQVAAVPLVGGSQTIVSSGIQQDVNISITMTTRGGPVFIGLTSGVPGFTDPASIRLSRGPGHGFAPTIYIMRGSTEIYRTTFEEIEEDFTSRSIQVPVSSIWALDTPPSGTHTYTIKVVTGDATMLIRNTRMIGWEL